MATKDGGLKGLENIRLRRGGVQDGHCVGAPAKAGRQAQGGRRGGNLRCVPYPTVPVARTTPCGLQLCLTSRSQKLPKWSPMLHFCEWWIPRAKLLWCWRMARDHTKSLIANSSECVISVPCRPASYPCRRCWPINRSRSNPSTPAVDLRTQARIVYDMVLLCALLHWACHPIQPLYEKILTLEFVEARIDDCESLASRLSTASV